MGVYSWGPVQFHDGGVEFIVGDSGDSRREDGEATDEMRGASRISDDAFKKSMESILQRVQDTVASQGKLLYCTTLYSFPSICTLFGSGVALRVSGISQIGFLKLCSRWLGFRICSLFRVVVIPDSV